MVTRESLKPWIVDALKNLAGKSRIPQIGRYIWEKHQAELEASGDFFYIRQYEMRWAGDQLVKEKRIVKAGAWELIN
jgi:hypothetical protein